MNRVDALTRLTFICAIFTALATNVRADHRVALLVGDNQQELASLAEALSRYGFRTTLSCDLQRVRCQQEMDRFVQSVPTRGTALVYFVGNCYVISEVLELLHATSGSSRQIVIIDGASERSQFETLPPGSLVGVGVGLAPRLAARLDDSTCFIEAIEATSMRLTKSLDYDSCLRQSTCTMISSPVSLHSGTRAGDEWVSARGMVFCWCPARKHERGFWLSKYELTRREWGLFAPPGISADNAVATDKNHPLDMISLQAIDAYIKNLNRVEREAGRLADGWEYGLPAEAEWLHACRAGTSSRFYFGEDRSSLVMHANFADRSLLGYNYTETTLDDKTAHLASVGTYLPNPWGLHDMYGNLWEVVETNSDQRVACGGSWVNAATECTSMSRVLPKPNEPRNFLGYRLAIKRKGKD